MSYIMLVDTRGVTIQMQNNAVVFLNVLTNLGP